ncbi:MAG TPA: hypothetical protein VMU84_12785, partial [Thermoanaerobaculia bacterium]|nr:hypothetical protein [Thermoanaerobaculia bacterium]
MTDRCLDAQVLAAFAERRLKRSEMPEVLTHLEGCTKCMSALKAAMDLMEPRQMSRQWLSIAAAIAVLLGLAPLAYRAFQSSETDRLVRLAPKSARVVEARLSGGFAWAPYRGPMRSTDQSSEAQRMKLIGAAGELVERADATKSADAQHAAGIGLVLVDKPEDAIARLTASTERAPNDARAWSDLAAAEYMTALRLGRTSLYPVALAHTDRAIRIDSKFAEALFNRALILERLGLTQFARDAWNQYLRVDPSSKWADEAREHLKRLPVATGESLFKRDQPLLEAAATRGDQREVDAIVDRYRQQSRTWAEAEYLGRWGAGEDGERNLTIARAIGDALVRISGESLLRDAVACIDRATPAQRATIAEAHAIYRRGRIAYSRREPAAAEPDLRRAAALFASANDPMAHVARYFAACTRFDQNDVANARRELETLREETTHAALGAQIRWELALCTILDSDWSASAALLSDAADTFERLGEKSNLAVMQTLHATSLISLGRPDEGWLLRAKAFEIQSGERRGNHIPLSIGDAARIELRVGRVESARALLAMEEIAHREAHNDEQLSNVLMRQSVIGGSDAAQIARDAMTVAQRVTDPELRQRAIADADFATGAATLTTDAHGAREHFTRAIDHYRATKKSFYLPEALLLRARASMRLGAREDAMRDLESGIEEVERHHAVVAGPVLGTGVIDAGRALYDEIVPLQLDRGDTGGAFLSAERARVVSVNNSPPSIAELQTMLASNDAAIVKLVVLDEEVILFCLTANDLRVSRHAIARTSVNALASREDDDASRTLYALFIQPFASTLKSARQLIVVADPALQQISFGALLDSATNRHLIETMPVSIALSATSLQVSRAGATPHSAVAIALPSGDANRTVALPEEAGELADVSRSYARVTEIRAEDASLPAFAAAAMHADVVHVAGHTERQTGAGESALLFRGRGSGNEPVTWSRIASMKLGQPIVVLAACETLRAPAS